MVRGKHLAIVGNAASLLTSSYGEEIDSHDLVVRFNCGIPDHFPSLDQSRAISPDAIRIGRGSRMDIWAGCQTPWVRTTTVPRPPGHRRPKRSIQAHQITLHKWNSVVQGAWIVPYCLQYALDPLLEEKAYDVGREFLKQLKEGLGGFGPTTGFVVCQLLLRFTEVGHLDLYGFDGFKSISYPTQLWGEGHKGPLELAILREHPERVTLR